MTIYRVKLFRRMSGRTMPFSALVTEYNVDVPDADEDKVRQMAVEAARGRGLIVDYAEIVGGAAKSGG